PAGELRDAVVDRERRTQRVGEKRFETRRQSPPRQVREERAGAVATGEVEECLQVGGGLTLLITHVGVGPAAQQRPGARRRRAARAARRPRRARKAPAAS